MNEETLLKVEKKKKNPIKLAIILGVVGIILAIGGFLGYKSLNKSQIEKYNNIITSGAKEYYAANSDDLPKAYGECKVVTLNELLTKELLSTSDTELFTGKNCDKEITSVRVCKLENGDYHYIPKLSCKGNDFNTKYNDWKEGSDSDLTANSDVEFSFLVQQMEVPVNLDNIKDETFWEDEIPYKQGEYTKTGEQIYYRFREKTYKWYVDNNKYYPKNETNVNKVSQYYPTQPHKDYNKKSAGVTAYRWYIGANQVYNNGAYSPEPQGVFTVKGEAGPDVVVATTDIPIPKSYRTIETGQTIYRLRALDSTDVVQSIQYQCTNTGSGTNLTSSSPCNDSLAIEAGTTTITGYKCVWKNDKTGAMKNDSSFHSYICEDIYFYKNFNNGNEGYGEWQVANCGYSATAKPYLCDRKTGAYIYTDRVFKWYTPATKTFINDTFGNPVYYTESPTAQALKDSGTATTAYKWYKSEKQDLGLSKTQPQSNAKKEEGIHYTNWSDYSLTKPTPTEGKEIQERRKLTIKKTASESTAWKNVTDTYVSETEAIAAVNNLGNNITSLLDILELPSFRYLVKVKYRNY